MRIFLCKIIIIKDVSYIFIFLQLIKISMLKRRRRIQKYINSLKLKKKLLTKEDVAKLKLEENEGSEGEADERLELMKQGVSIPKLTFDDNSEETKEKVQNVWHDSDEQQVINLPKKNVYRKLQMDEEATEQQYEQRLRKFYNNKYGMKNWAVEGEGQQEKDLKDMLNQEDIYVQSQRKIQKIQVQYIGRTTEHHTSVVTGLDFKGSVAASCGLDQKLKLWSLNANETNPQLKIKLQKDVYVQNYSLFGCYFTQNGIVAGTLRQNYVRIDCQKWKITYIGSSFLNQHKSFQNLRLNNDRNQRLIFSQNRISLIDDNNVYQGSLLSNESLVDAQFGKDYSVLGISHDSLFQWDTRMWKMVSSRKDYMGYTKLWTGDNTIALGSKLGIVRLSNFNNDILQQYAQVSNLVTHVTDLKSNVSNSLLIECSKWKANALRLIDIRRGKCIAGWPGVKTKVGLPMVAAFSSKNELGVGNSNGHINFFSVNQTE